MFLIASIPGGSFPEEHVEPGNEATTTVVQLLCIKLFSKMHGIGLGAWQCNFSHS